MLPVISTSRTFSPEAPWLLLADPTLYNESRTLDYSKIYTADLTHPWWREDGKFIIPSGIPLAKDAAAAGLDRNLVFPVKRMVLTANATNAAVVYEVADAIPFIVGDEINITGGTPQAITAINYDTNLLTVAVTIGVAGTAGTTEIFTPDHDVALGHLMNPCDLSMGAYDIITSMLLQGHVYETILINQVIAVSATVRAALVTAGIRFITSTAV